MSTIDTVGNIHKGAGVPGGGQFTGRVNAAPTGQLTDTTDCTREGRHVKTSRHTAADCPVTEGAPPTAAEILMRTYQQQVEDIRRRQRELNAPAITAITAHITERYPGAEQLHLFVDIGDDGGDRITVGQIVDKSGPVHITVEDENIIDEIILTVAATRDDLKELPRVTQGPDPETFILPIHRDAQHQGSRGDVEEAFFQAVNSGVYDVDLAGAALRSAAGRLIPDADAIVFEKVYDDTIRLTVDTVQGGIFDGARYDDIPGFDELDDIIMSMSGRGSTGEQTTGIEHVDGDHYILRLKD